VFLYAIPFFVLGAYLCHAAFLARVAWHFKNNELGHRCLINLVLTLIFGLAFFLGALLAEWDFHHGSKLSGILTMLAPIALVLNLGMMLWFLVLVGLVRSTLTRALLANRLTLPARPIS